MNRKINRSREIEDMALSEISIIDRELVLGSETANANKKNYSQWRIIGDGSFSPNPPTVVKLESGLYEPYYIQRDQTWGLKKLSINTDELYELPTEEISNILDDLKKFWSRAETYKKYKLMHKRGILLYGDPGCGKSGILQLCMKYIIEKFEGLVINIKDDESVRGYIDLIENMREVEPERPLVVIIEDIDAIADEGSYVTSQLLNMLDGIKQIENVTYIATTNYPEKLEERITNRPSRFDRRYYVSPPDKDVRLSYLKNKAQSVDPIPEIDYDKWTNDTDGMSISHLKELFISVIVMDNDYESSIKQLKELKKSPRGKGQKDVGFKN
jgi:hypothetical protein